MNLILYKIPNILTLLRIAAAPLLMILLLNEQFNLALLLFIAAGLTDGIDGYIAKKFNCVTELGARLDPLADKILIISSTCTLAWLSLIPFEFMLLVIFRDLVIVGGYMVLSVDDEIKMQPTMTSKLNTLLQISYVISVLLESSIWVTQYIIDDILLWSAIITTIASGIQYVWVWAIRRSYKADPSSDSKT